MQQVPIESDSCKPRNCVLVISAREKAITHDGPYKAVADCDLALGAVTSLILAFAPAAFWTELFRLI